MFESNQFRFSLQSEKRGDILFLDNSYFRLSRASGKGLPKKGLLNIFLVTAPRSHVTVENHRNLSRRFTRYSLAEIPETHPQIIFENKKIKKH